MSENAPESVIFKPFDADSFAETKDDWIRIATKGDAFPSDVEQTLKWAGDHRTLVNNEMAYGVFKGASKIAVGICEVIISHPAKKAWVKLLRLRLHPEVEDQL